jgi:ubiquinol oxidase
MPHHKPQNFSDRIALMFVLASRLFADAFFAKRYGPRAVVLETVAAVPGMVGALFQHLKSLRRIQDDGGWIRMLLDEAENERMHLMVYVALAHPSVIERMIIVCAQIIFFTGYFFIYLFSPKTGHRIVGYLEEEAVKSYTMFLESIDNGTHANPPAPALAINYWHLSVNATLRDVVIATRGDEIRHRDTNHRFADDILSGSR